MNPVYEGYFSQLRFYSQSGEADESEGGGEQERFMIPKGQWEISSRLPGAKYSYRVVQQDDSSSDCFLNIEYFSYVFNRNTALLKRKMPLDQSKE